MAVQKQYHPLLETDDYPTAERVRDAYLEKTEKTRTILEFFAQHNEPYLQKVKMDPTNKTYWRYELTEYIDYITWRFNISRTEYKLIFFLI